MKLLTMAAASLAILTLSALPAVAQNTVTEWSSAHYDVTGSAPGAEHTACIMTSTFEIVGRSDIEFSLLFNGIDDVTLSLRSNDWSPVAEQIYPDFHYYFPGSKRLFNGEESTEGFISPSTGEKGFLAFFGEEFLSPMATENRLMVARIAEGSDDPVIVADLNLNGTGEAIAALRRCATYVVNREAARIRREGRFDYIEKNPF